MSLIVEQIKSDYTELFALEFGKIAESDFVYTLSSTNINQSAPNLVKMYVIIRSRMSSIMDLIRPELTELSDVSSPSRNKFQFFSQIYFVFKCFPFGQTTVVA